MLNTLKRLFARSKPDFAELSRQGAQIIDVRTVAEFKSGHIQGSRNIPLDRIADQTSKIRKDKPVITCCRSGVRSASAANILRSYGFPEVYNGGGWTQLNRKLQNPSQ